MRRSTKKKVIPLALALVLAIMGATLAVPAINLSVQELGQGHAAIESNIEKAKITWHLDDNNPDYLKSSGQVTVDLSDTQNTITDGGKIYVKLYDTTGNLVAIGSAALSSSQTSYDIDLTIVYDANGDGKIGLDEFSEVYVVYEGPNP